MRPNMYSPSPSPSTNIPDSAQRNLYQVDRFAAAMAQRYIEPELYAHLEPYLQETGQAAGGHLDVLAMTADHHPPTLQTRSRTSENVFHIAKHPAYIELERYAYEKLGLAAMSHRAGVFGWDRPLPCVVKYTFTMLFVQAEFGLCCPVSMTDSLARTLRKFGSAELVARVLPGVIATDFANLKQGAMFMTEQAAGSDVGGTLTEAIEQADGTWKLYGEKWFCSNPDAAYAMVLARSENQSGLKGVSLFLLPREQADGSLNHYRIVRLKDKLGTRSMASGEIALEGATAWLVGERGRGFNHMTDMINNSRLSNGVRAAGLMQRALNEALYVAQERWAFARPLQHLPLMQRQLLKLIVPTEQARSMVYQTAQVLDQADEGQERAQKLLRIMTPLIKFRACRDARRVTGDGMEVRGGCGYIEEWAEPRLVRDAHLGSIWEGTSNIVALDVLRAIERQHCLEYLEQHVQYLLNNGLPCRQALQDAQDQAVSNAFELARYAARHKREDLARQVASALYHVLTMAAMRWEAQDSALRQRAELADLVLLHRVLPKDPLAHGAEQAQVSAKLISAWWPA